MAKGHSRKPRHRRVASMWRGRGAALAAFLTFLTACTYSSWRQEAVPAPPVVLYSSGKRDGAREMYAKGPSVEKAQPSNTLHVAAVQGTMSAAAAYKRFWKAQNDFLIERSLAYRKLVAPDCQLIFQYGDGETMVFNTTAGVEMWMEAIGDFTRPHLDKVGVWLMDIDEESRVVVEGAYFPGFGDGIDNYYFTPDGLVRKLLYRFDKCEADPPICKSKHSGVELGDWL